MKKNNLQRLTNVLTTVPHNQWACLYTRIQYAVNCIVAYETLMLTRYIFHVIDVAVKVFSLYPDFVAAS